MGVGELANVDVLAPRCGSVYRTCIELDVPLLVHTGAGAGARPLQRPGAQPACHPSAALLRPSAPALHPQQSPYPSYAPIRQWSGGFIPFARVVHAKYMVVDGEQAWVGTSNWERDYFTQTRNVGVIVEGEAFASQLERFFQDNWSSPYAAEVDPKAPYTAPNVSGTP